MRWIRFGPSDGFWHRVETSRVLSVVTVKIVIVRTRAIRTLCGQMFETTVTPSSVPGIGAQVCPTCLAILRHESPARFPRRMVA